MLVNQTVYQSIVILNAYHYKSGQTDGMHCELIY